MLNNQGMVRPVRVGLLLESLSVPAWAKLMVDEIQRSEYAEVVCAVVNTPASGGASPLHVREWVADKASSAVHKALHAFYARVLSFKTSIPDAFAPERIEPLLKGVPIITVKPRRTKLSDYFEDESIAEIGAHSPDVLIRLGFRILRGKILTLAPCGVWSYHHGDNRVNRGGPAGFWESMEGWPETGSMLQILTEDLDNGIILHRSTSCTFDYSVHHNRCNLYWKTLWFIPRKLQELSRAGAVRFLEKHRRQSSAPVLYSRRLYKTPTNSEMLYLCWKRLRSRVVAWIRAKLYFEQWCLLYDLRKQPGLSTSFWRFKKITPPPDRFWADPHLLMKNDRYYVFLEEFPYKTAQGHISVLEIDQQGRVGTPRKVLERPYHLAYPYVFEIGDTIYMIPDTRQNKTIELYRCTEFPDKWEFDSTIMEGVLAVDTTVFNYENRWWLFTNMAMHEGTTNWDELFLFHSDTFPSAKWNPHPLNPVVSDVSTSRPAGKILVENGRIYRPSQNCSHRYGYGLNLMEIVTLTPEDYEERLATRAEPDWEKGIVGTHSITNANRLTVIDALRMRRKHGN